MITFRSGGSKHRNKLGFSGESDGYRGARTPFDKSRPRPPITPHTRQNPLGHRESKFKFEVMLNRWRKNYRYRIPIKLNFDFSLSITAGFDNLSI